MVILIAVHLFYYIKVCFLEKRIFEVKDVIDNLEPDIADKLLGSLSGQDYLDRVVAKKEKPLRNKMERLQMQRQYILDKLPLLGLLKK